jgi:hypothetical protein
LIEAARRHTDIGRGVGRCRKNEVVSWKTRWLSILKAGCWLLG